MISEIIDELIQIREKNEMSLEEKKEWLIENLIICDSELNCLLEDNQEKAEENKNHKFDEAQILQVLDQLKTVSKRITNEYNEEDSYDLEEEVRSIFGITEYFFENYSI